MTPTTIRIGHAPQPALAERRARLFNQLARYGIAWTVVSIACYWMALGDSPRALALLAIAGFISGPRRHTSRRARQPGQAGATVEHGSAPAVDPDGVSVHRPESHWSAVQGCSWDRRSPRPPSG